MEDTKPNRKRKLRALDPVAIHAAAVSQLTSLATLGIDPRRFLEFVVPRCTHVTKIGRLRVVELGEAYRVLRAAADTEGGDDASDAPANDRELESVDSILASIGRRRVGGER